MSSAIESQLNETFRDALVGYYLSEVVPNHVPIKEMGLSGKLKTANDLFEFLLLDVQVSQAVDSSYVASAISSLQQYVNAVLMGMEPGYLDQVLNANQLAEWRDQRSQYPIWAANQKLLYYPELYIDPMLRLHRSGYFKQLETDINQNKIEVDTVQEAVKAYLASFEEVANLSIINGYIDSNDFTTGTYYFIGKSRAEQQYYWRSVNMNDRPYVKGMEGPKSDYPNPGAWSDWEKANIGITPNTLEHTIRPVYFNNRLFVTWVDFSEVEQAEASTNEEGLLEVASAPKVKLTMYVSYKKYDSSWGAPRAYIEAQMDSGDLGKDVESIAIFDSSRSPQGMVLAIYSGEKGTGQFWRICLVDKNFNSEILIDAGDDADDLSSIKTIFSIVNYDRMQFQIDPVMNVAEIEDVVTPSGYRFNYDGLQELVKIADREDFSYRAADGKLALNSFIKGPGLTSRRHRIHCEFEFVRPQYCEFNIFLVSPAINGMYVLDERSSVVSDFEEEVLFSVRYATHSGSELLLIKEDDGVGVSLKNGSSLANYRIPLEFFDQNHDEGSITILHVLTKLPTASTFWRETYRFWFGFASSLVNLPLSILINTSSSSSSYNLAAGAKASVTIQVNPQTGLPESGYQSLDGNDFHVIYGVEAQIQEEGQGGGLHCVKVRLGFTAPDVDKYVSPRISLSAASGFGVSEYIDFTGSTLELNDEGTSERNSIRMNTLFARELVNKANVALENLLAWETQQLKEPPLDIELAPPMDFHGANGLYFWELFFHLPLMVAQRLNLERQFDGSDQWLGFIFDPSRKSDATGRPDYWNVRPLEEDSVRDYAMRMPIDPDGLASSNPVIYKKATYSYYIKNLIDRGDSAYRQLTPDSLTEAKLWYVRVTDLLGPRPDTMLINDWTPVSLTELHAASSAGLRAFEQKLLEQDERSQASAVANDGTSQIRFREQPLQLSTFTADPMLAEVDNPAFRVPLNAELVKHWDTVESRLYNLQHNLTLDGKPMSLPLFAAPLDPRALLAAFANGSAGGGLATLMGQEVGHYRYATLYNHASAAVEALIQFGNTLLSLIERKEASELQEVQQKQVWEFAQFAIELQEQTQKLEIENRNALLASQKIADQRALFYSQLADEGVSVGETTAIALLASARMTGGVAAISRGLSILAQAERMIGGFSIGNFHIGAPMLQAVATAGEATSDLNSMAADIVDRAEIYRRRQEDWEHAHNQARLESEQIDAQLKVCDEQARLTAIQLRQAKIAYEQARVNYEFLGKRFTKSQLYQWLNSQISSFYYQAYDTTLSLCLAVEACWQFERADFSSRFVRPSAWNDSYRGLLAGESLKLDLLKMNTAYLTRNERLLEIVKTVSARQLPASTPEAPTLNTGWDIVQDRLKEEGVAEFELTKAMLDDDYPNHYLRRIKRISVSLPVTVGPYQDIRALLTQTYSAVHLAPGDDVAPRENLRASQQIAVSTGVDDDGLFVFNFDDERYLPFEGTGVISRWTLEFPNREGQLKMIDSITDIIVHVRYTAKSGGSVTTRSQPARISKARAQKPQ